MYIGHKKPLQVKGAVLWFFAVALKPQKTWQVKKNIIRDPAVVNVVKWSKILLCFSN